MTTLSAIRDRVGRFAARYRRDADITLRIDTADDGDPVAAASNRRSFPEDLQRLSLHGDFNVRVAVAANPFSPPRAIARLLNDPDPRVRTAAAGHDHASDEQLRLMLRDPENTPAETAATILRARRAPLEVPHSHLEIT